MTEVLDRLSETYRTRALYLGDNTRIVVDQLYAAGFRAAGGHGDIQELESYVRALRISMQDDLEIREVERVARIGKATRLDPQ